MALGTRLAAPAHREQVVTAYRTALGEAHALVEAACARESRSPGAHEHVEVWSSTVTADAERDVLERSTSSSNALA